MSQAPFTRRMVFWLVVFGVLSFAVGAFFSVRGRDPAAEPTADASSYSRSAIGHHALARVLRKLDVPVVVSQYDSGGRAGGSAALVLLEPLVFGEGSVRKLEQMLERANTVLVVLPKWTGEVDENDPKKLGSARLMSEWEVNEVLRAVAPNGSVLRTGALSPTIWRSDPAFPAPTLRAAQLMTAPDLEPIISTGAGVLLGALPRETGVLWILSDPDLLSNHGIGEGDNAVLAVEILEQLRGGRGIVIDETLHGYVKEPSIWRTMFEMPYVLATAQLVLMMILGLWATTRRFGAPVPRQPHIEPGKEFLVDNTASLLHFGGHGGYTLRRYLQTTLREVGDRLRAGVDLDDTALAAWLERVGASRGTSVPLSQIIEQIDAIASARRPNPRQLVLAANRLYGWKQEMLHGPANHPSD